VAKSRPEEERIVLERWIIVVLMTFVIFLVWERFHYRRRISDVYDVVLELTAGLEKSFELRGHPQLRRYFGLDAILDEISAKLELLSGKEDSGEEDGVGLSNEYSEARRFPRTRQWRVGMSRKPQLARVARWSDAGGSGAGESV
jgi:hypothetical protein